MKSYVQEGDTLTISAPSGGVVSGQPFVFGGQVVVPVCTAAQTEAVAVKTEGVIEFARLTGGSTAWAEGDKIFWDEANDRFTKVSTSNTFAGIAAAATLDGDATGKVRLITLPKSANVAAESTANGSDATTTQALANALKTKVNAILTALKDAGIMLNV